MIRNTKKHHLHYFIESYQKQSNVRLTITTMRQNRAQDKEMLETGNNQSENVLGGGGGHLQFNFPTNHTVRTI